MCGAPNTGGYLNDKASVHRFIGGLTSVYDICPCLYHTQVRPPSPWLVWACSASNPSSLPWSCWRLPSLWLKMVVLRVKPSSCAHARSSLTRPRSLEARENEIFYFLGRYGGPPMEDSVSIGVVTLRVEVIRRRRLVVVLLTNAPAM